MDIDSRLEEIPLLKDGELELLLDDVGLNNNLKMGVVNNLYGINSSWYPVPVMSDRDTDRYVFFSRPDMNMTRLNLIKDPNMLWLLNNKKDGVHNYIRHMLDPSLRYSTDDNDATSILIDHNSPWMVPFTNTLQTLTGWPDLSLDFKTSSEGILKEQQSVPDGVIDVFNTFDLSATFRNVQMDVVNPAIRAWLTYMSGVKIGKLYPYPRNLFDAMDFNTSMYVIVMGTATNKIKRIVCTGGGSTPTNLGWGRFFDKSQTNPMLDNNDTSTQFKTDGMEFNEILAMNRFNELTASFNPAVADFLAKKTDHGLVRLPSGSAYQGRFRSIPLIDVENGTLEWLLPKEFIKG